MGDHTVSEQSQQIQDQQPSRNAIIENATSSAIPDFTVKAGLAQMLKGGVIMDVVNVEQVCTEMTMLDITSV